MKTSRFALALVCFLAARPTLAQQKKQAERMPTKQEIARIEAAAPAKAPAKPARPRKLLVWGHVYTHLPNPFANEAFKALGRKTGAFEATISDDPNLMLSERIAAFDAVVMNNIHEREPFLPADLGKRPKAEQETFRKRDQACKKSLLAFVAGGKGLVGVHATTAACQTWPEYGEMVGGYYGGHIVQEVPLRNEEPDHPVNAALGGKGWTIRDEIYLFRAPYDRGKLRVLLSLDLEKMTDPAKRPDKDYAVTWVKPYGKGRVFYCSLGHMPEVYWDPTFLRHVLAGTQFALGDLNAPCEPRKP